MIGYFLRMSLLPRTFLNPYLESINECHPMWVRIVDTGKSKFNCNLLLYLIDSFKEIAQETFDQIKLSQATCNINIFGCVRKKSQPTKVCSNKDASVCCFDQKQ